MAMKFILFLALILGGSSPASADDFERAENAQIAELIHEPLYVSLGSMCETTHVLRACGLRKAAFPFDWITTIDDEKFLELLERNFEDFLYENFLAVGEQGPGPLMQTYYHMEFLHDGDFRGDSYLPTMEKFQAKYQRRIQRFQSLANYPGKVFFIRSAYPHSLDDPHRTYISRSNLEITDEYAWRLFHNLKNLFPKLDFTLILINHFHENDLIEEKRLSEDIIKIRIDMSIENKIERYLNYFNSLN